MMDFTKIKKLTIGGVELKQLFINGIQVWKSGYKNWVKYSTEADGVTIYGLDYNGDGKNDGYKDGYRIRSGGAEGTATYGTCTGFIPLRKGETLRIYPKFNGLNATNAINFFDSTFTNLGQITDSGALYGICTNTGTLYKPVSTDNILILTLTDAHDARIAYVRITHDRSSAILETGADLIVTINEEIE